MHDILVSPTVLDKQQHTTNLVSSCFFHLIIYPGNCSRVVHKDYVEKFP